MKRLLLFLLSATGALAQVATPPDSIGNWPIANSVLSLTDPNLANQVVGWDDTLNKFVWVTNGSGGGAPTNATYITQTANSTLTNEQSLGALATGMVKNTTTAGTGVLSIGTAKTDYWDTTDFVASGGTHAHGLVPDPGSTAGTAKFLREDATWQVPPSGGSVPTGTGFYHITTAGTLDSAAVGETGTGNVIRAAGAALTGLTGLGIRDTSAAFDVTIAATSSTTLTAGRTLTIDMVNAARTLKLAGNVNLAANFTTSGANSLTLTTTGSTNVTLPTTGTVATLDGVERFTNKRIDPRVQDNNAVSSSPVTPDSDSYDEIVYRGITVALTINAPSGTPVKGQKLLLRLRDNGSTIALTFTGGTNGFRFGSDVTAPTATTGAKSLYMGFRWNEVDSKWDCIAKADGY